MKSWVQAVSAMLYGVGAGIDVSAHVRLLGGVSSGTEFDSCGSGGHQCGEQRAVSG